MYRKNYNLSIIGSRLREVRKVRKLSAEDVREYLLLECTQSVYKWERGESLPQADTLIALCVFYQIDPLILFGESIPDSSFYIKSRNQLTNSLFIYKANIDKI